jgi:hypothetical protein
MTDHSPLNSRPSADSWALPASQVGKRMGDASDSMGDASHSATAQAKRSDLGIEQQEDEAQVRPVAGAAGTASDAAAPVASDAVAGNAWWRTVRAVAWSMIGLRKGSEHQQDAVRISPLHVMAVGLVALALLVGALIVLVKTVV